MGPVARLVRRLPRPLLLFVVAFYVFCIISLFGLRSFVPITTTVQVQRRIESFLKEADYEKRQTWLPLTAMPVHFRHAVIAAEDGRFFEHDGVDWSELKKVVKDYDRGGKLRGASTISQQLVKNLFLTTHHSIIRKALEFTLVPLAELILPKERILALYLNVIEWGPGVYGAEAAARRHYGISVAELSRDQSARLAACIPAPRSRTPQQMNAYSARILQRMKSRGW